ncbi:MAG: hypothetical protein ABI675_02905 [Chitinophagaceae bacterium]
MEHFPTTDEVGAILKESYSAHRAFRLHEPAFEVEALYLFFFNDLLNWMAIPKDDNIILAVQQLVEKCYSEASIAICKVMSQHSVDGSSIWEFINDRRIILRRDQQQYNRQIPGKFKKGIRSELWYDYNHWLIAIHLWEGFIQSLQPSFSVIIPMYSDDPIEKLLAPEIKPLWGMWEAYGELGRPSYEGGNTGDAIYVKPWASLMKYKREVTSLDKYWRNSWMNGL